FEAAAVEPSQLLASLHQVQRRPLLRARFREHERTPVEIERRDGAASADLRAPRLPVEAARDHEVQDQEEVLLEREHDALADPFDARHSLAASLRDRRRDRPQEKRASEADLLEPLADDARTKRLEIGGDVRKLRHGTEA